MKKALLLCSTHNDLGIIRSLKKLGFYIIVTGNIENLPGQSLCDEYIKADYSDKELILQISQQKQIDCIIQCCNDFGVYTASYVAEKMRLPGYDSYETTLLLHNKDKFKEFCKNNNIISPVSNGFKTRKDAINFLNNITYPIIIKPVDCSAGNGISKAENNNQALKSIEFAFSKSRSSRIVIEPYLKGTQHGYCTFLKNKKVVAVCSNNEYSFINPYRVEIDTFPADNYEKVKEILNQQIEQIASLLNLTDGIFHLQYIYDGKKTYIIEVMRRILGNMYHVPGNLVTNLDWEYWDTRAHCGLSLDDFPMKITQTGFFAYKSLMSTKNGIIKEIKTPVEMEHFIMSRYFLKKIGDKIDNYLSEPIAFYFLKFPDYSSMKKVLIDEYEDMVIMDSEGN